MKIFISILLFAGLLLINTGCSVFISSRGKDLETVFTTNATRQSVQREFGPPVGSVALDKARRLSEIPEIRSLPASRQPSDMTALTTGSEDYRYKGMIYDLGASQTAGMALGMTFGLSEIVMFPASLAYAASERKKEHFFRVWYSPAGRCVAYFWRPPEEEEAKTKTIK